MKTKVMEEAAGFDVGVLVSSLCTVALGHEPPCTGNCFVMSLTLSSVDAQPHLSPQKL